MRAAAAQRARARASTWALVHDERRALVELLEGLEPERWEHPSLCPGWSVHDVAAHLVDNARTTTPRLLAAMARARFDFDRQNQQGVDRERGADPARTVARLREVAGRTSGPPAPLDSRLVEEVLHGEDIRRPLGYAHRYAPEAVDRSLRYQARTRVGLGGGRERVVGLTLRPDDREPQDRAPVAAGAGPPTGEDDGPVVTGPALSLLLVVSGRGTALGDLSGPGLDLLRDRVSRP